ncbi:phage tail protein [Paenibacillus sp. 598K]|uniref:baseplate J/gp47 family protein n=1 Tax=Paenibacillus sp. 598K TaxID=1117987 RepID=UPI000FFA86BF|nr:baseplate J/gp47 family protein [Paenibacillus sp. 598K]GBF75761.1 phage tail protein [Paenibacillus sp. 598K]
MYEAQTFKSILERMLDRVPDNIDKRESSIIYDALAPAAVELANLYHELDVNYQLFFADTATGEYLTRRAAEHGVTRKPATAAVRLAKFLDEQGALVEVSVGSRLAAEGNAYRVTNRLALGQYELTSETTGVLGNQYFGAILPLDYIPSLATAELLDVIAPGQEEESDGALRARFMQAINEQPFGGNVADYRAKIGSFPGVGGVKVYPVWNGGGTVKVTIIDSNFDAPSSFLLQSVQETIDPPDTSGQGLGLAPIGHQVTVAGAQPVVIDIETTLTLQEGITLSQIEQEVQAIIAAYFLLLREAWAAESGIVVRVSQLESRILGISGVSDITSTFLNGESANIELQTDEIPIVGEVVLRG